MFTLEYANTPVYGNAEGTNIQLIVKWEEFNKEMPFAATSYDSMPHGVALYNRAKAGEFGEIAPYVAQIVAEDQPNTTGSQTL
jgi:hypothetical protein